MSDFKVIITKHTAGGASRGPRIIARASGGERVIYDYSHADSFDKRHENAARALMKKLGWLETIAPLIHAQYDNNHVFLLPY